MRIRNFLKMKDAHIAAIPVFVLGTGRSGTHWLGFSLEAHQDVFATIERKDIFDLVTQMAIDPSKKGKMLPKLIKKYREILRECKKAIYLDKSHPNIWHVDELKMAFPGALFLGIERNVYATVSSMLKHPGVSAWHLNWKSYPVPNPFLGIDREAADSYDLLSMPARCAMRWVAHKKRMEYVKENYADSTFLIDYDAFALDPEKTMTDLQKFLKLDRCIQTPEVNIESLDKWKSVLTAEDISAIDGVVGRSGISAP